MENIIENNKLIAEFLVNNEGNLVKIRDGVYSTIDDNEVPDDDLTINDLKFHSDWNWLMKVVEKIHSMQSYGVLINPNGTYIQDEDDKVICMTFKNEEVNGEIISSSNIEATFNCCVEFVRWYNKQNKK